MIQINNTKILSKLQYQETDSIYLSGSIIEGFGNTRSDIDAFILTSEKKLNEIHGKNIFVVIIDGIPVDIEYIYTDDLIEKIDELNGLDFTDPNLCLMFKYSEDDLKMLHRLLIGKPIYNEMKFHQLRNRLKKEQLSRYLLRRYINFFDNGLNDVIGAYESMDYYTAVFGSRALFNLAIDIYLVGCGDTNISDKWRARRLLKYVGEESDIFKKYLAVHLTNLSIEEDYIKYIEEMIGYSSDLVERVQEKFGGM